MLVQCCWCILRSCQRPVYAYFGIGALFTADEDGLATAAQFGKVAIILRALFNQEIAAMVKRDFIITTHSNAVMGVDTVGVR